MSARASVTGIIAVAAAAAAALTSCTPPGATAADFAALRMCESSGDYSINTGNGYYGAYQFDQQTWDGLGFSGLPSLANPAVQDAAAYTLYNQRGWAPWPTCSARLGLTDDGPAPPLPPQPPAWQGTYLSTALAGEQRMDTYAWQAQMHNSGWTVVPVTGYFDNTTAAVAAFFSSLALVNDGAPGVVGPNLWASTFSTWTG
jgi:hypothetical protein